MTKEEFDNLTFPCTLMVVWSTHRPLRGTPLDSLYHVDNVTLDLHEMIKSGVRYPIIKLCRNREHAERLLEKSTESEDFLFHMGDYPQQRVKIELDKAIEQIAQQVEQDRSICRSI